MPGYPFKSITTDLWIKMTATNVETFFSEQQIFHMAGSRAATLNCIVSMDCDKNSFDLAAPCMQSTHRSSGGIDRSISSTYIPDTWTRYRGLSIRFRKLCNLLAECMHYRPISLTPILCRVLEKLSSQIIDLPRWLTMSSTKNYSVTSMPLALLRSIKACTCISLSYL